MIYPPPADPHKLMECVDWMDEELLKGITKKYFPLLACIHLNEDFHDLSL